MLDEFDKKIISALQEDGRLSNLDVAKIVGLSHSSCSRRISKMIREGVITGCRMLTDRKKLGLSVRAYCGIIRDAGTNLDKIANELALIDGVVSVFGFSGDVDLMIEVVAKNMDQFSDVIMRKIYEIEGVKATRSSFVLAEFKSIY